MNPDRPKGEEQRGKEMERTELEPKIRAAIVKNQDALLAVPKEASDTEYWNALRREGQPSKLHVRRLESDTIDIQPDMYLLQEEEGQVDVTYFREDGEIGETFGIAMDRITAVE